MRLPPLYPLDVPSGTTTDLNLLGGFCLLRGWAFLETAGAVASLEIRDGQVEATSTLRVPISLLANESTRDFLPGLGIVIESGILLEMLAGTVEGVVYVTPGQLLDRDGGGHLFWPQVDQ